MRISNSMALQVWWAHVWRHTLSLVPFCVVIIFAAPQLSRLVVAVLSLILSLLSVALSIYFFSKVFNRNYASFSVSLHSTRNHDRVIMTRKHAAILWWSRTWRLVAYTMGFVFVYIFARYILGLLFVVLPPLSEGGSLLIGCMIDFYCFKALLEIRYEKWKVVTAPYKPEGIAA